MPCPGCRARYCSRSCSGWVAAARLSIRLGSIAMTAWFDESEIPRDIDMIIWPFKKRAFGSAHGSGARPHSHTHVRVVDSATSTRMRIWRGAKEYSYYAISCSTLCIDVHPLSPRVGNRRNRRAAETTRRDAPPKVDAAGAHHAPGGGPGAARSNSACSDGSGQTKRHVASPTSSLMNDSCRHRRRRRRRRR